MSAPAQHGALARCGLALACLLSACSCPQVDEPERHPSPRVEPTWVDLVLPLHSSDRSTVNDDLNHLRSSLAGAKVIALGEGTHGSHEFFTLRERLLDWSIAELGVRVLAIEASMTEVAELDRYIQGEGSPQRAAELLLRGSTWPWRTVEFAATLEWLRRDNAGREPNERVRLYGFDIQQPWVTAAYLEQALAEHPRLLDALRSPALERITWRHADYEDQLDDEQRAETLAALVELDAELRAMTPALDPLLLRIFATLLQVERHYRLGGHVGLSPEREQAMADNIRWIAERQPQQAPIMVWAHNGHVSRTPLHRSHSDAMGRHLAEQLGEAFVNVGFVFVEGSFLAQARHEDDKPIREFCVPRGPDEGVGLQFAAAKQPRFILDLRTLPATDPLRAWLAEPRPMWTVGSAVGEPHKQASKVALLDAFDLLVFVDEVTAAELLSRSPE
jgi:erythromycin esterase